MSKSNKSRTKGKAAGQGHVPSGNASDPAKALNALLLEVVENAQRATLGNNPSTELGRFDRAIFERGVSVLHAVYVLVRAGHWETANAPVRQLFELLANMEHLNTHPDRELAAIGFVQFGSLQEALAEMGELEFAQSRGLEVSLARLIRVKSLLEGPVYAEFRTGSDKKGKPVWAKSWSGKNLRQLCEESTKELRMVNYRTLFSAWSEQAHSTPGALVRGIVSSVFPDRPYLQEDRAQAESVTAMALVQFLELWEILPDAPPLAKQLRQVWLARLQSLMIIHRADGRPVLIEFDDSG